MINIKDYLISDTSATLRMELLSDFPSFSSRILSISACKNKDLMAVLFAGSLVIYRADGSIVSQYKTSQEKIVNFQFEPNGRWICVAFAHRMEILHAETCSKVFECDLKASHLNWKNNQRVYY